MSTFVNRTYKNEDYFHALYPAFISSCNLPKAYFQQALEYHIKVQLNDSEHSLTGEIKIVYKNNSPDVLDKIGFHLWPNAYKNKNTSFSKQKIKQDDLNFFTASDSDRGFIDKLDFKVNNIPCFLQFEKIVKKWPG